MARRDPATAAPLHANDAPGSVDALAWARVAGLVDIQADGSWALASQSVPGMLEFLGQAHPFGVDSPRQSSGPGILPVSPFTLVTATSTNKASQCSPS